MARIFISYATPDRAIADEVASWLRADGHEPFLAHDLRNGIGAGEDWKQRLYDELREGRRDDRRGDVVLCGVALVLGRVGGSPTRGVACSCRCERSPALSIR